MDIIKRVVRDKEVRNKLILTFALLFIVLIGYRIPLPGVNVAYAKYVFGWLSSSSGSAMGYLTGNSFTQMSLFALSISPYITASIVMQFLQFAVKPLADIAHDGSQGKAKMEKITIGVGAIIAIVESLALAIKYGEGGLFYNYNAWMVVYVTIAWTIGSCILIWIGQLITNKLIGNGTSMILMFNTLSALPADLRNIHMSLTVGKNTFAKISAAIGIVVVFLLLFAFVYILQKAEKGIKVTNSGKIGRRMAKADENRMPLKLNSSGVMPIILSTTFLSILSTIFNFFNSSNNLTLGFIINCLNPGTWFRPQAPIYSIGALFYIIFTFVFSVLYTRINFNVNEVTDILKQQGSIVNNLKPGEQTAAYLKKQSDRLMWIGTTMLVLIAVIPMALSGIFSIVGLSFGGTSIIIVVGALVEIHSSILAKSSYTSYNKLFHVKKGD